MNIPISNNTRLRIVKSMVITTIIILDFIGIDNWAMRKGMNYGTIIVDANIRRPIYLLDSRGFKDVVDWLCSHKDIKFITRDRATAYSCAVTKAISEAKQIAE